MEENNSQVSNALLTSHNIITNAKMYKTGDRKGLVSDFGLSSFFKLRSNRQNTEFELQQ